MLAIVLLAGAIPLLPSFTVLGGWSIDVLTALRSRAFADRRAPQDSSVVVIALDEQTVRSPPFRGSPIFAWTPELGRVLTAVVAGGAKVVGFDVVFAASLEESEIPFGDATLGDKTRGFDREFLRALAPAATAGKLVLGEAQLGDEPILPTAGQRLAVGQQRNIRALNVYDDPDGVVRRVPLTLQVDGRRTPAMALELAARALGARPEASANSGLRLAGYSVPQALPNTMTLNFAGGVPTYSLADLRACLDKTDTDFFRRQFEGKVVLVGSTLDSVDRRSTSARFAASPAAAGERCASPASPTTPAPREMIDGVYIQATAVDNLLRRDALTELAPLPSAITTTAFAALSALAAMLLGPLAAVAAFVVAGLAGTAGAVAAFEGDVAAPLFPALASGALALGMTMAFRVAVVDREQRFLRKAFALYLAPSVIDTMLAAGAPPALGGETRVVTVLFSDLAGFSTLSETLAPAEIVALMNRYFTAMTEIVEANGGFVDKYIGDAMVAIFGAPLERANHAADAVRAALQCREALEAFNRSEQTNGLRHRIGINTGEAVVGNIGSRRRFNYTAFGDSVNVAARLEGANDNFGTDILVSEDAKTRAGDDFSWRELDIVRVRGRERPVTVYEPLAARGEESAPRRAQAEAYARGLVAWRARDFVGAVDSFALYAAEDPPAARFLARARALAQSPPGPHWEPVQALERK